MLTMVTFHKKKAQSKYTKCLKHMVSTQLLSKKCEASKNFPKIFLLGGLWDTSSSCRSLSRQFKFKAPAAGCLSHFNKSFPCHFILKDVALTSNSKKNNTGRVLLSLDVSLMPG